MTVYLRKATASQECPLGQMLSSADGATAFTTQIEVTDIHLWKAGATTLAHSSGVSAHISNGVHYITLDATDTDTAGPLVIYTQPSGALPARQECIVLNAAVYDASFASGVLPVDLVNVHGTALTETATQLAAGISKFFDVATPTSTMNLITAVTTCTTNTDMRGTDSAALATEMAKVPKSDSNVTWNATALGSIQTECNDALIANNLDHLLLEPVAEDMTSQCADGSIFGRFLTGGNTSDFISTDCITDIHAEIVGLIADVGDAGLGTSVISRLDEIIVDTGTNLPADNVTLLAAVSGIGTAGGAAINMDVFDDNVNGDMTDCTIAAINAMTFTGTEGSGAGLGTFTATSILDGTIQQITHATNAIDIVYMLKTGGGTTPIGVVWTGRLNQSGDTCLVQAWNHVGSAWETVGTIDGQASATTNIVKNMVLYTRHRGTSSDELGKVYIRFYSNATVSGQILKTDQLYVSYSVTSKTVGYADGAVWINTVTGATGTEPYVYGTADNPVKTIAEALTIATTVGLKRFRVANGSTITLGATVGGYSFIGHNWTLALNNQNIAAAYFEGAAVTGTSTGAAAAFYECSIGATCTVSGGLFQKCAFNGTFTTVTSTDYTFVDCWDGRPGGTNNAIIVLTATVTCGFRNWFGGIQINTLKSTNTVVVEGYGRLIIHTDCEDGTIIVRGPISVTDNVAGTFVATGGTLTQTERLNTPPTSAEITDAVWDEVLHTDHEVAR